MYRGDQSLSTHHDARDLAVSLAVHDSMGEKPVNTNGNVRQNRTTRDGITPTSTANRLLTASSSLDHSGIMRSKYRLACERTIDVIRATILTMDRS